MICENEKGSKAEVVNEKKKYKRDGKTRTETPQKSSSSNIFIPRGKLGVFLEDSREDIVI